MGRQRINQITFACAAKTKLGWDCPFPALSNDRFCWHHTIVPQKERCHAQKKQSPGQCKYPVQFPGAHYCAFHSNNNFKYRNEDAKRLAKFRAFDKLAKEDFESETFYPSFPNSYDFTNDPKQRIKIRTGLAYHWKHVRNKIIWSKEGKFKAERPKAEQVLSYMAFCRNRQLAAIMIDLMMGLDILK